MSAPSSALSQPRVLIPFLIATAIWGSTWLVIRDQLGTVPPSWSITYRFIIAAVAMGVWAVARGDRIVPHRSEWPFLLALGLTQFVLNFNFVYRAEEHITSGLVAVIFALIIAPNALMARAALGTPITRRFLVGSAVALGGVALLIVQEARAAPATVNAALGVALTLAGVLSASVANVMQGRPVARAMPMATMLAWSMAIGVAINATYALATSGAPVIDWRPGYWLGIAYLGIFASAVAFSAYFHVIRSVGPAVAGYSGVLSPVIAMLLSTLFEGYRWTVLAIGGSVLAAIGLLIALSARRPAA